MPTPTIHLIVPLFILLLFYKEHYKTILALSFFALVPDLDSFTGMHRALFHNILFAVVVSGVAYLLQKRVGYFIFFFMVSHIVLDVFNGGASMFYPFYQNLFYIDTSIGIDSFMALSYVFNFGFVEPVNGGWVNAVGDVMSKTDIAIIMLIILALIRSKA